MKRAGDFNVYISIDFGDVSFSTNYYPEIVLFGGVHVDEVKDIIMTQAIAACDRLDRLTS